MMRNKICVFLLVIAVLLFGSSLAEETALLSGLSDLETFNAIDYIIGSDLPAGEYILFRTQNEKGFFHLASDSDDTEALAEDYFDTNVIVTVKDGEYLIVDSCVAVRAEDFYREKAIGAGLYGTMLKVGYDLEPGLYTLNVKPGSVGCCIIFGSSRFAAEDIIENYEVEALSQIEVQEGQYIQLVDCCIAGGETLPVIDKSKALKPSDSLLDQAETKEDEAEEETEPDEAQEPEEDLDELAELSILDVDLISDLEIFDEVDYIVGSDLLPGEYILFRTAEETGYFRLTTDIFESDLIAEEYFDTNVIVTVKNDEYFVKENCVAVRTKDYYKNRRIGTGLYGAMLKVGYDLEPGVYTLDVKPGEVGRCVISDSSRHTEKDIAEEYIGETLPQIEVQKGQYLQLIDCRITDGEKTPVIEGTFGIQDDPQEWNRTEFEDDTMELMADQDESDDSVEDDNDESEDDDEDDNDESDTMGTVTIHNGNDITVRSIPSTKGEEVGKANAGSSYDLLDSNDRWYQIRLEDGTEGWIVNSYAEIE